LELEVVSGAVLMVDDGFDDDDAAAAAAAAVVEFNPGVVTDDTWCC
jgi:hypothetical protein